MIRLALLVLLAAVPLRAQEASEDVDARLTEFKGSVTVFTSEDPEGAPGEKDMPLDAGDRIKTAADSSAEVSFNSGGSVISLRSYTDFTLTQPRRADSVLTLNLGSLLAKINALSGRLRVKTPTAVAAVRGTEFGVEIPEENADETHVAVFDEGSVEVHTADETGSPETLIANQETKVSRGQRPAASYQLKRLVRHRQYVRTMRKRASWLRKNWKTLSPEKRRELRKKSIERLRQNREKMRVRLKQRGEERKERRKTRVPDDKMEKRRQRIREGLRNP